jgi:cytoskeletal protein RodZ
VTVGETLTEARYQAGLSIDELSERTRIRGTVIRSIEQDDFGACGGDLYVRGYVRAIAGAVGIDAQPLIREYDQGRVTSQGGVANDSAGKHTLELPSVPPPVDPPAAFDLPAVSGDAAGDGGRVDLEETRYDLPAVSADPATTSYDLPRVAEVPPTAEFPAAVPLADVPPAVLPPAAAQPPGTAETRFDLAALPDDLMAAGYDLGPAEPAGPGSATAIFPAVGGDGAGGDGAGPGEPNGQPLPVQTGGAGDGQARRKRRGLLAVGAIVLVVAAALGVTLATGSTATKNTAATTVPSQDAASAAAKASAAAAKASAAAAAKASASAQASASASAQASRAAAAKAAAQRVTTLSVASAAAYGPDGFADGDDPGNASDVIARGASQPWTSQWYVSPDFGMLKHGTGLLLDLGRKATVTSVRLDLAGYQGANLQIRVGNSTASQDLLVAAKANDVGGVVKLTLRHPTAARYLLIWFTQLPPDGAGHYAASVSHVVVTGRR